jgi:hypothetical protein
MKYGPNGDNGHEKVGTLSAKSKLTATPGQFTNLAITGAIARFVIRRRGYYRLDSGHPIVSRARFDDLQAGRNAAPDSVR